MISEILSACESDLRRAIGCQQFGSANALIDIYCRLAEKQAAALPADNPERRAILLRVQEVLEWARLFTLSARAAWAEELNRLPLVGAYLETASDETRGPGLDF